MEECWKSLPTALALHVVSFMDDIDVRRAFGFLPRRLTQLPNLQLNRDKITSYAGSTFLNLTTQGGEKVYQLMWMFGAFPGFFYQRTNRIRFMTVPDTSVVVWRDTEVHQDMFSYAVNL
jgi:hypothetical protein